MEFCQTRGKEREAYEWTVLQVIDLYIFLILLVISTMFSPSVKGSHLFFWGVLVRRVACLHIT